MTTTFNSDGLIYRDGRLIGRILHMPAPVPADLTPDEFYTTGVRFYGNLGCWFIFDRFNRLWSTNAKPKHWRGMRPKVLAISKQVAIQTMIDYSLEAEAEGQMVTFLRARRDTALASAAAWREEWRWWRRRKDFGSDMQAAYQNYRRDMATAEYHRLQILAQLAADKGAATAAAAFGHVMRLLFS